MHLHIVCTNPDGNGNQVIVPVCSAVKDQTDETCMLLPHEHDFIVRPSFVLYARVCQMTETYLSEASRVARCT